MLLVEMQQDFDIRFGPEGMALLDQYFFQLAIVEDLAIAHQHHGTVFVVDRLVATLQIDNAQTPEAQRHIMVNKIAGGVGATMDQLVSHAHQQLLIGLALTAHINKTYKTTHEIFFTHKQGTKSTEAELKTVKINFASFVPFYGYYWQRGQCS